MMKHEKSCGAVVYSYVDSKLSILLIRHKNGGHWAFPKGHVEKGETELQTAQREILEETGLKPVIDTKFRHTVTYSPKENVTKDVIYFSAKSESTDTTAQIEELLEIKWLEPKEAIKSVTFDNDKKILNAFLEYINN